jgi:hypothetical protein
MRTVKIPIYGGKLIVARTQEEHDAAYKRLLASSGLSATEESTTLAAGGMTTHAVVDNRLVIIAGVFERNDPIRAHEATHCAQAVAEAVCMNPLKELEAFAYLTQWFFQELGR